MEYRIDPKSGNKLSVLGFGCMRFLSKAGHIDIDKAEELIMHAYNQGVNYYDTAFLYGESEEVLGKILAKNQIREKIYIATKLPQSKCDKREDFDSYFETELKRLQTDYIDYYLMHNVTNFAQWEKLCELGIIEWIKDKKEKKQIRQIGFSFHGTLMEFDKMLEAYDWDFLQIQYNYVNEHYQAGIEGLQKAYNKNIPVMIMEPLLGGKLINALPKEALAEMEKGRNGSTPASWALNWVWNHKEVTLLLSGMNRMEQLEENLALADKAVPDMMTENDHKIIKKVLEHFNKSYKIKCTGCNYCMPCPKKINIPGVFAAYNASYAISWTTGIFQYALNAGMTKETSHHAGDCISCGKCAKQCPQHINIPQEMKRVRRRLQIPGMKGMLKIYNKISK